MASADVFKDVHAKTITQDRNDSSTNTTNALTLKQKGTGDNCLYFDSGSTDYILGTDGSSGDILFLNNTTGDIATSPILKIDALGRVGVKATASCGQLTVDSTDRAFVPPRMTSAQMEAITGLVSGAMVYNNTSGAMFVWKSTWQALDWID